MDGLTLDGVWRWRYSSGTVFLITVVSTFIQMIANQREKFQTSAIGAVELALCVIICGWVVSCLHTALAVMLLTAALTSPVDRPLLCDLHFDPRVQLISGSYTLNPSRPEEVLDLVNDQ